MTARGYTQDVCVVTGHLDPDDPGSRVRWQALAQGPGTLVILMGHDRLPLLMDGLVRHGRAADTPAACVEQGTTSAQRVVVSTVGQLAADVAAAGLSAPVATVVGDVVTPAGEAPMVRLTTQPCTRSSRSRFAILRSPRRHLAPAAADPRRRRARRAQQRRPRRTSTDLVTDEDALRRGAGSAARRRARRRRRADGRRRHHHARRRLPRPGRRRAPTA